MHVYTLECEMTTPVPIGDAFRVFEDPYNLVRITPPDLNLVVTNSEPVVIRKGAEIWYTIRVAGVPLKWKTVITEYQAPHFFVDEQVVGPYRLWRHRHTLEATPRGTVVKDRVEYALPFGWLGRLVHRFYVRRKLELIFAYRQAALARLLVG